MAHTMSSPRPARPRHRAPRGLRAAAASAIAAVVGAAVALAPSSASAQEIDQERQEDYDTAHSVLQKTGLVTLGLTGLSGATLMINKPTAFGDGRCKSGDPIFGDFGCGGLTFLHLGFAVTTLGLFVAQEVVAEQAPISPYDQGSEGKQDAMAGFRVANYALFGVQPVLGLLAANPGILGVDDADKEDVSRALRTVHFGVGGGLATTYTANAIMQW
jgi:hypothetical protein